jgi:hypothetical protein
MALRIGLHDDGHIVHVLPEYVQICKQELIGFVMTHEVGDSITLAELYDALSEKIDGLESREGPDDHETSRWCIWLYGLLWLVCDDCDQNREPLLPAVVRKEDGSVW